MLALAKVKMACGKPARSTRQAVWGLQLENAVQLVDEQPVQSAQIVPAYRTW